jgi:hypothetical protein
MQNDRIYFKEFRIPSQQMRIFFLVYGVCLIVSFGKLYSTDPFVAYMTLLVGFLTILWNLVIYANKKGLFRGFVRVSNDGITIVKWPFLKSNHFSWEEFAKIDLSHFEPRLVLKNDRHIMLIMQYEQQLKYRKALTEIAHHVDLKTLLP